MIPQASTDRSGPVKLHQADAFEFLPSLADLSVDVTIADPPFDARTHATALESSSEGGRRIGGALPFAPLVGAELDTVAYHLCRVTRRWILVFCADRQIEPWARAIEAVGSRVIRVGVAMRSNPRPQMTGDRPAPPADWIVIAHRPGRMRWNGGGRPAAWSSPPARHDPGGQVHPTQKPLALMRALVEDFACTGEVVLDPFAGSGSTAVACKELGRRFLGCERDPGYHAVALRRLDATREQLRLTGQQWEQERLLG